jgi:hypothetical protein
MEQRLRRLEALVMASDRRIEALEAQAHVQRKVRRAAPTSAQLHRPGPRGKNHGF